MEDKIGVVMIGCTGGFYFILLYLSKTRYVVEQSFGTLHRKFRYARAAYFGLLKVSAQSHLKAMCLNLLKAVNRLSAPVAA